MFLKSSPFFLILHFIFLMLALNLFEFYDLAFFYFSPTQSWSNFSQVMLCLDHMSAFFVLMVSVVTFIVVIYSQVYLEHYMNKKFMTLLILFFSSMIFLSFSDSLLLAMIGWDGLGVSSIFLIMFYPNNTTLYNSLLTMFFNRLGDVVLIIVICHFVINYDTFFFLSESVGGGSLIFIFGVLICGFAKSAQFPLSSWLPAAMSAPTPISAMVHSSTLVTAGIFLLNKFSFIIMSFPLLLCFWFFFSFLTFLSGGALSSMELDFKKMVAFSTMSQISMMMVFSSLGFLSLALLHMLYHAFFKTLLFCCCGMMFMYFFSLQQEKLLKMGSHNFNNSFLFFLSIFSMTGLIFSSSFFSKDLVLEIFSTFFNGIIFIFFLLGSLLTLIYCSKMMIKCADSTMMFSYASTKKFNFYSFLFLSFLILMSGKIFSTLVFLEVQPLISNSDLLLVLLSLTGAMFLVSFFGGMILNFFPMEVSFMKFFTFTLFSKFMNLSTLVSSSFHSDLLFSGKNFSSFKIHFGSSYFSINMIVMILCLIFGLTY